LEPFEIYEVYEAGYRKGTVRKKSRQKWVSVSEAESVS